MENLFASWSCESTQIAPTAVSIVRRVGRVDRRLPRRGAIWGAGEDEESAAGIAERESAWRSAEQIAAASGLYRDTSGLADPESPLAF